MRRNIGPHHAAGREADGVAGDMGQTTDTQDSGARLGHYWTLVAAGLRHDLGARTFDHWLGRVTPAGYCAESGVLRLVVPSRFAANWIAERFADRLLLAWRQHVPGVSRVAVHPAGPDSPGADAPAAALPASPPHALPPPGQWGHAAPPGPPPAVDPRLTFANFIIGRSNNLAASAAQRMAALPPPQFNPLYLHAGTGQGKTHLLSAIAASFAAACPDASIILMSAEKFMVQFVTAMRAKDMLAFKARLRAADLLLIDDLQFVMGKDSTQEELLHTFDDVLTGGRRLVVAADRAPALLDGVEARLVSRLGGGLVADIDPPEPELRAAILRARLAANPAVAVPDEVIAWLVTHFARNIREMEGALNKLVAHSGLTGTPITLTLAQDRLAETVRCARSRVTIDDIQRAVCRHFRLERSDMASPRRARAVARPRQIAMFLAKEMTLRSYPEIGRRFGGRDHSTVMHAVRTIEDLRVRDREIDADIIAIRRILHNS